MLSLINSIINTKISEAEKKRLNMYEILDKYDLSNHVHIKNAIYTYINLTDERILYSKDSFVLEIYIQKMIYTMLHKNTNQNKICKYKFD